MFCSEDTVESCHILNQTFGSSSSALHVLRRSDFTAVTFTAELTMVTVFLFCFFPALPDVIVMSCARSHVIQDLESQKEDAVGAG